jgi:hypothetical protein
VERRLAQANLINNHGQLMLESAIQELQKRYQLRHLPGD